MSRSTINRAALLAILVLTIIWSLNWTVGKLAMRDSGPFMFSALRFIVGTAGLFIILAILRRPLKPTPWGYTVLIGLTQTAAFQTFSQWSLVSGGAGKMALLAYSMPFWTVLLAWWWLREAPNPRRWLCIAGAALGFVCVVEPWKPLGAPHSLAMALFSGLMWAVSVVLSKRCFRAFPDVTPLRLTAWQMVVGTVVLILVAGFMPEHSVHWTPLYVGALLYSGLLGSSIAWAAWAAVVRLVPASVAGLTSLAVPVGSVLWAWGLLHEAPSTAEWVGIGLISLALVTLNFTGAPETPPATGRTVGKADTP
ncbi:MAG TPA: DMT family transporter [Nevskiaceae bacterium]|nr:DMT family transporter [Nevskiaceae bacterium]